MTIIRLQNCRRCKHGEVADATHVECRRYPPQVTGTLVPTGNGQAALAMQATFPKLSADAYCGEWATKFAANEDVIDLTSNGESGAFEVYQLPPVQAAA